MTKIKCWFCRGDVQYNSCHHFIDYMLLKKFFEIRYGVPKSHKEHLARQSKLMFLKDSSPVIPLCDECHREWETFLNAIKKEIWGVIENKEDPFKSKIEGE